MLGLVRLFIIFIVVFNQYCSPRNIQRLNSQAQLTELQVASIIVTFSHGHSFDELFTTVKQQSKAGSVVLTYKVEYLQEKYLADALGEYTAATEDRMLNQLVIQISKLERKCPTCIVFNWQCSDGFGHQQMNDSTFILLSIIIKRGFMAMFSDYSLKALINSWQQEVLGPNPFIRVGNTNKQIKMKFDKNQLLRSPSSQLQAIGRLSVSDQLLVRVMSNTITYAVNPDVRSKGYQLQVLTIAQGLEAPQRRFYSHIGNYRGLASHVLISYNQGGKILTSMGHWIELLKIETDKQRFFQSAQLLFGAKQAESIQRQYQQLSTQSQKQQYISRKSKLYVQNQSPGSNNILMKERVYKNSNDL